LHHLGDHGIPVAAVQVVEQAVLAGTQVAGLAVGHHGHDVPRLALHLGRTLAVEQECAAELGHIGMGAHVGNPDTEVAAALVDEEPAHLEHGAGAFPATVEIGKYHVVAEQPRKLAIVEHQLLPVVDRLRFRLEGLVSLD
ncbi:hypothetical protein DCD76_18545, partial [Acinetobacter baumannii]